MNNFLSQLTWMLNKRIPAPIILEQTNGCWDHYYFQYLPGYTNLETLANNLYNFFERYEYYTPLEGEVIYQHRLLPPFRVTESRDPYIHSFTLDMLVA